MLPARCRATSARRALRALGLALAVAVAVGSAPAMAEADMPEHLTGTYELLAKDDLDADGHMSETYTEVLRVPGRKAYPLSLPADHGLRGGTRVKVSAMRTSSGTMDVQSFSRLEQPTYTRTTPSSTIGGTGTTSVLVVLAYWTKPDSVTPARAHAQFFGDDDRWFREVSYGAAGLAGAVTPWVRIPAPAGGKCYADSEMMLYNATNKAAKLGTKYDAAYYNRTVLYFPRCSGGDTVGTAGWAYQPGNVSWLNGYMDRRTSVHEQGHNYGLGHARSYRCRSAGGTLVTLARNCVSSTYGDPYDAMGRSYYSAHFTGYRKQQAGWLGSRKRVLASSAPTTFTLPPFEKPSTKPLVVVAPSPTVLTRSYWLEYRRPVGMDARLPAGATGGVLLHLVDTGKSGWLLDGTPRDGSMTTAVLRPGTKWVAPDYVKITVGTATSTGIRVTVSGARNAPVAPSPPRNVVATAHDGGGMVSWSAPSFAGNSTIAGYDVVATAPERVTFRSSVGPTVRSTPLWHLANGARYTVSVVARTATHRSAPAATWVVPTEMPPSVRLVAPTGGARLSGAVTMAAEATANPSSGASLSCLYVYVDGEWAGGECGTSSVTFEYDTLRLSNGTHTVYAQASDSNGRTARTAPVSVVVDNPEPTVTITAPAPDTVFPDTERLTFRATASVPADPSMAVTHVTYYDVTDGYYRVVAGAGAPFEATGGVSGVSGVRKYVAVATAANGRTGQSEPVSVTIQHPASTLAVTAPAAESSVGGSTVRFTTEHAVRAAQSTPTHVTFYVDGYYVGSDTTAPFTFDWDTAEVTGRHTVSAVLYESTGRSANAPPVAFTVANALPTVTMTSPGGSVPHGTVRFAGTARPGAGGEAPARVEVLLESTKLGEAPVAADGTWSFEWQTGTRYGWYQTTARAYTASGLRATARSYVSIYRPEPTAAIESPAGGTSVVNGSTVEVVVAAAPAANDYRTVARACFVVGYGDVPTCSSERGADGRYRIPWPVNRPVGRTWLRPVIRMSDGTDHAVGSSVEVTVTG